MKESMVVTKGQKIKAPLDMKKQGIAYLQVVSYEINYFGSVVKNTLDTKIMDNGKQFVIDGDGFIKPGFEIK